MKKFYWLLAAPIVASSATFKAGVTMPAPIPYRIVLDTSDVMTIYTPKDHPCIDLLETDASILMSAGGKILSARRICVKELKK